LDFFGDQVVCHFTPGEPATPESLYPRHFGVTFRAATDFEALHACAVTRKIPFYHDVSLRFEGLVEEHRTFVLVDPTGNLLEFKHYNDPRMLYYEGHPRYAHGSNGRPPATAMMSTSRTHAVPRRSATRT